MSVRLSNDHYVPSKYQLSVRVDLSTWTYHVREVITLSQQQQLDTTAASSQPTPNAVVHMHAAPTIAIEESSLVGCRIASRDADRSLISFEVLHHATVNADVEATIAFEFTHTMQEDQRGFYKVEYTQGSGGEQRTRRMAATHFEPIGARRFFVCLDEPAARADFELTVLVPAAEELTVLSNGKLAHAASLHDEGNLWTQHTFESVPKVPPYLCALVVGHLSCLETSVDGIEGPIPIRMYTTSEKTHLGKFALDAAAFSLVQFERFFGCAYPLPKLDMVAVPEFPIGGMENWGCICLVESTLVDTQTAPLQSLKQVSNLVCHEVSHNWFGNLVGIDWWEGLWLKEGFASWCGYYATDLWHPEWGVMEDAVSDIHGALMVDQCQGSHPVEVAIADPSLITQVFDSISYDKGMAVVMMLRTYLGDAAFRCGIQSYMRQFAYKNTVTAQLWQTMEAATGKPVAAVMGSFTQHVGFPLIDVSVLENGESGGNGEATTSIRCRQCRCCTAAATEVNALLGEASAAAGNGSDLWCVPLVVRSGLPQEPPHQNVRSLDLSLQEQLFSIGMCEVPIKLNPLHTGFYRCRYSGALMQDLIASFPKLPFQDQRGLISDLFALLDVDADTASDDLLRSVLTVMECVSGTPHCSTPVLQAYFNCVHHLADALRDDSPVTATRDAHEGLLEAALSFTLPLAEELYVKSAKDCTPSESKRRTMIISQALTLLRSRRDDCSPLSRWAISIGTQLLNDADPTPEPDLMLPVLLHTVAFAANPMELRDLMMRKLEATTGNVAMSRTLVSAMCRLPLPEFVASLLTTSTEGRSTLIRAQVGHLLFHSAAENATFRPKMWNFFQENQALIARQWGSGQFRIQSIVDSVGRTVLSGAPDGGEPHQQVRQFSQFFAEHPLPNAALNVHRAAERMLLNSRIERSLGPRLQRFLMKRK